MKSLLALLLLIGAIALMIDGPSWELPHDPIYRLLLFAGVVFVIWSVGYLIGSAMTRSPYDVCHDCPARLEGEKREED